MVTVRRVGLHLPATVLVGALTVCYLGAMLWSIHGPLAPISLWAFLAISVVSLGLRSNCHWARPTVIALVGLGVVAAFVGFHGGGSWAITLGRTYGPDAFYAYAYDWQTNTLHHGMTNPGSSPLVRTRPNRESLVVGAISLALGIYGMLPDRWLPDAENAS